MSTRAALAFAGLVLLAGCEQARPPEPVRAPAKSPALVLREEGDALSAKGDYAGAAAKYEAALRLDPDNVGLHFALGSVFSHLNRRADAIREFQWVVERGPAGSDDVQAARRWLIAAGVLREEGGRQTASTETSAPTTAGEEAKAGLKGKVDWKGVEVGGPAVPVRLMLQGDDLANQQVKQGRITRMGSQYVFPDVPPGNYKLTGTAMKPETPLWEHRIVIEKGKMTVLDLSNANSSAPPDALARQQR